MDTPQVLSATAPCQGAPVTAPSFTPQCVAGAGFWFNPRGAILRLTQHDVMSHCAAGDWQECFRALGYAGGNKDRQVLQVIGGRWPRRHKGGCNGSQLILCGFQPWCTSMQGVFMLLHRTGVPDQLTV